MHLEGLDYQSGKPIRLVIKEGKISEVIHIPIVDNHLPIIAPGLVDIQLNGYGGIDFNKTPLVASEQNRVVKLLAQQGVTSFFPTLITNTDDSIRQALQTIVSACKTYPELAAAIGGIHLEGPFLSKEDGARGAHDPKLVKQPDWNLFKEWQTIAEGKIKIITLSPEWDNSVEFIRQCSKSGVIVSIGHTAASPHQIDKAVKAGARLSTHLGNAAHLMLPRHPNYIWNNLLMMNCGLLSLQMGSICLILS